MEKGKGRRLQILNSFPFMFHFAKLLSSFRVLDAIQRCVLFICCTLYMANLLVGAELYGSGSLVGVSCYYCCLLQLKSVFKC